MHRALGVLHTHGYPVGWTELLKGVTGPVVPLPTYAFRRQRYWLEPTRSLADVAAAGLSPSAHPLLGAATTLANQEGVLFTTRLSLADHPWLADHVVFGQVLLPGTAVLELALAAAQAVGGRTIAELILSAPLALTLQGALRLQLFAGEPDGTGARTFALYSRDDAAPEDAPWTCHATGLLGSTEEPGAFEDSGVQLEQWPPPGAVPIDLTDIYPKLASQGLVYGPAFQGLTEAWREGTTLYGRAVLPDRIADSASEYGIHPALSDAALHVLAAAWLGEDETVSGQVLLPFGWSEVALHRTGPSELRIRMTLLEASDGTEAIATLDLFDATCERIASVGKLRLRRATTEQVRQASRLASQALFRVEWQPAVLTEASVPMAQWAIVGRSLGQELGLTAYEDVASLRAALDAGAEAPQRLLVDALTAVEGHEEVPQAAQRAAAHALAELQDLLSEPRLVATPLVWVTRSAVGTGPDDQVRDLAHAPLWGLLRSARSEHPDRTLRLVDLDASSLSGERLASLLSADDEADLALRHGVPLAARLVRAGSGCDGAACS